MIKIKVEDRNGDLRDLAIAESSALNLMELLKLQGYEMRATCGGMALCADCHCLVVEGEALLSPPEEEELITLDTRPDAQDNSRLSCQIKVSDRINDLHIRLMGLLDD